MHSGNTEAVREPVPSDVSGRFDRPWLVIHDVVLIGA
jgi:hypothetical protein